MVKTKQEFLKSAIIKTILTGLLYLLMPIPASIYWKYIGHEWWGYTVLGGGILILGNVILLVRAWVLALDSFTREQYNKND